MNGAGEPFRVVFRSQLAHGRCVGVALPTEAHPLDPEAACFSTLRPTERQWAAGLGGVKQVTWLGGRLALRAAISDIGGNPAAILSDARGAPALPPDWMGSISHKEHLAVALAAPAGAARIGIDLEERTPLRRAFARRILSPAERTVLEGLCDGDLGHALAVRFSLKEAIYKALDPFLQRHIAFAEVTIRGGQRGPFATALTLRENEGAFDVDVNLAECGRYWLSTARVRALEKKEPSENLSVHPEPLQN